MSCPECIFMTCCIGCIRMPKGLPTRVYPGRGQIHVVAMIYHPHHLMFCRSVSSSGMICSFRIVFGKRREPRTELE